MEYKTCQKKIIYDFFANNPDKHFSADEVFLNVSELGCGKSTVYRLISKMSEEGQLIKSVEEGSHRSVYRLALESCSHHWHLKCVKCGTVIHLDEIMSEHFQNEVFKTNQFSIDGSTAVLNGFCSDCKISG